MIQDLQDRAHYQLHYSYIDSSQEEENGLQINQHQAKNIFSNLTNQYVSSSSNQTQSQNQNLKHKLNKNNKANSKSRKLCKINSDNFLLGDQYLLQIQKIIKQNHQKLTKRTPLLIPGTDNQILQNLQKRKKNYGFFLKALQVDRNYNNKLTRKVQKLKEQNQRKKTVLHSRKIKQTMEEEGDEMKKFVLDKKTKEQIVIDKIQKHAYKLGIERIRAEQKKIKNVVKQIDYSNTIKVVNLQVKQRNKIQQLREQLEMMRETNRINKVDQKKVLKDLQKNVQSNKQLILTKAENTQQRKFII